MRVSLLSLYASSFFIAAPLQLPAPAMRTAVRRAWVHESSFLQSQKDDALEPPQHDDPTPEAPWYVPAFPGTEETTAAPNTTTAAPTTSPVPFFPPTTGSSGEQVGPEVIIRPPGTPGNPRQDTNATIPQEDPQQHAPPSDETWLIPTPAADTTNSPAPAAPSEGPGGEAVQPPEEATPPVDEQHWVIPTAAPTTTTAATTPAPTTPPATPPAPSPPRPGHGSGEMSSEETFWGPIVQPKETAHGVVALQLPTDAPDAVPSGTVKQIVVVTAQPPVVGEFHTSSFVHYKYGHTKKYRRVAF